MKKLNITKFGFRGIILLILFPILLFGFLLDDKANAQTDINWSIRADSVATGAGGSQGVPNNIRDDNTNTYYRAYDSNPEGGDAYINYWASITFSQATVINKVEICHEAGADQVGGTTWYVDLYYAGAWNVVMTETDNFPKTTHSSATGWSGVSAIRVRAVGEASSPPQEHPAIIWHSTYELRAWGPPPYVDCGLRIRTGTQTLAIACEPAGILTSPLRIRKGATTYGIVLVATTDPNASPIRIWTSSGVKALRKY
jgi:hypothetical protein